MGSDIVDGISALTGVPPEFKVMIAPPTVTNTVVVGMGTTTELIAPTKVSDAAPGDG